MSPFIQKFSIAFLAALLAIVLTQEEILKLGILQRLELASIDYRFQERGKNPSIADSSHIVIIEVNDESSRSLPDQWPWPRSYYARVIRNLKAAGARAIGLDIILNGPDAYSPANDEELRAAIRETGIVVLAGEMEVSREGYQLRSASNNYGNQFYPVDSTLGLANVRNDADGVYRRYSPYWETVFPAGQNFSDTARVPTFSFALLNKYLGLGPHALASNLPTYFLYADRSIPKYDPTSLLINFQGPSGTFRRVKFVDVIDDESFTTLEEKASGQEINTFSDTAYGYKHDGTFSNKVVLIGSTTPKDHDLFPVSVATGSQQGDNLMYGVEIHANVVESILQNRFLSRQSKLSEILVVIGCSMLTFFAASAVRRRRSKRHFVSEVYGFLLIVIEAGCIAAISIWLFSNKSFVLTTISPMVAILGGYIASTAYDFVVERKQRIMIKSMFSVYVNPKVVDELIAHPDRLKLGGERKLLTVLFSDIEGFTSISEGMPSETLVALLNEYFKEMTEIILKNNGTLDKFFGDAIIAFWGAPIPQENHALRACTAAIEMQQKLSNLRSRWKAEGKPLIQVRMGINTGDMVVGNMGGKEKFDYTVIGDSVNIASRLEGANKVFKTGIMVSESTYNAVKGEILGRELDLISVKGRSEPFRTFELIQLRTHDISGDLLQFLDCYALGIHHYRARRWEEAEKKFSEAFRYRADDYPTRLYLERAAHFKINPPPEDWTSVFELTSK